MEDNDKLNEDIDVTDGDVPAADETEETEISESRRGGKAWLILLIAVAVVVGASFVPWSRITGGKVKDFNLISDIISGSNDTIEVDERESMDPELLKAQKEEELNRQGIADATDTIIQPVQPNKSGDLTIIEDYTSGSHGLSRFKAALADGRVARIAVVGDSYIEGDIMCQDLRSKMQTAYGGAGVGYMNMHSDFPGFRRSVKQGGNGWKSFLANGKCNFEFMWLAEQYAKPTGNATSTYQGVTALPHLEKWTSSKFMFIAPNSTTISIKAGGEWKEHAVTGQAGVQCISVDTLTTDFDIKINDPSLISLGVWLDGANGVAVDCMSSRGFSGITLTKINPELCHQMSKYLDYDLIILEFGINAMSSKQTNYNVYQSRMVEVIRHVRECYPKADILLMGIGDRGEKSNGAIKSMKSCPYMVAAQRDAARQAHCLFWDTREAMGGEDAIVGWAQEGCANKDYIHLTHKGGDRLATALFNALQNALKE